MTKHTPGPWDTDRAEHTEPLQDIVIKAGKHRRICVVWIDDAPVEDYNAEQRANARLIAAAPDLLAALQRAFAAMLAAGPQDYQQDDPETNYDAAIDAARAAIAKAKGTTT